MLGNYRLIAAGLLMFAHLNAAGAPVYGIAAGGTNSNLAAAQQHATDPYQIVSTGVGALREFLNQNPNRDPEAIHTFLERAIAPRFDFATMGRWAAGPFYRRLDAEQRAQFHDKLRGLFLSSLARNLGSFARTVPPVQIFPPAARRWGDEMLVRARVLPPGGYPVALDFRFFRQGDDWKIFDVGANGFSAVSYYRRHFARLVRVRGPRALYQ